MSKHPQDRFEHPAALEFELLSIAEEEGFDVTASRPAIDIDSTTADRAKVFFWPWVIAGLSLISFVGLDGDAYIPEKVQSRCATGCKATATNAR